MSKRNWLLHPPVGVGLIILGMFIATGLISHERNSKSSDKTANKELSKVSEIVSASAPTAVKAPPPEPNPKRNEWREEKDLVAQQEMADWAWFAMVATWCGALATVVGVYFVRETLVSTRKTLDAAEKTIEVTRDMARDQSRAYVQASQASITWHGCKSRSNTTSQKRLICSAAPD